MSFLLSWHGILDAICQIIYGIVAGVLSACLMGYIIARKMKRQQMEETRGMTAHLFNPNESYWPELWKAKCVRIYAVNSFKWANIIGLGLNQNPSKRIQELVVLIRKKPSETEEDLKRLDDVVNQWKRMYEAGQIKKITILSYGKDSEHYYTVLGKSTALVGHVIPVTNIPTGADVDEVPIVFTKKTDDGKKIINHFIEHFDQMRELNKQNIIFSAKKDSRRERVSNTTNRGDI